MSRRTVNGYVYLIHSPGLGIWKIGMSASPGGRAKQLKGSTGHTCELIHTIKSNDARRLEKELHAEFRQFRTEGEWFRLDEAAVESICNTTDRNYEKGCEITTAVQFRQAINLPAEWVSVAKKIATQNKHPVTFCVVDLLRKEAESRGITDLPPTPWDDEMNY